MRVFRGKIGVYLSSTHVDAVRAGRWPGSKALASATRECAAPGEGPAWLESTRALEALLRTEGWRGQVDVALSSEFVRLALLPGVDPSLTEPELRALATALLARTHGGAESGWSIRFCALDDATVLVAGIEAGLQSAIEQSVAAAQCRLGALRPLAAAALDGEIALPRKGDLWVAFAERTSSMVGLRRDGAWRSLRVGPRGLAHWPQFAAGLERERMRLGSESRAALCIAEREPPPLEGWSLAYRERKFALLA